ncbi:hypothetical protein CFS9_02100 [Flavobacterium sp. CFS9]|uniref:Beta-carotene 15,15'-monooxygenase n=1 Tax=Flavobacterium sp. CFS9 TaxID=3143118 RepID=A0AAT9GWH2_9FLAO
MKSTSDQIKDIKNHGYTLDFSTVFNHAFENYKKIAVYAGLILLVFSVFFGLVAYLVVDAIFSVDKLTKLYLLNFQPQNLSQINIIIYVMATALVSAIMSPFTAGFLKMADCAEKDQEFNVSTIFSYYKSRHFSQIFLATFLISLFSVIVTTFLEIQKLNSLGLVFSLVLSFFTFLTIPLIVFGNLKAVDAISSSFLLISRQPLMFIALMITIAGAMLVGLCAFCIGIIFTIPFSYSMTYAIYCAIIKTDKEDPIDAIGQSDF